jgi:hypothetical protein
LGKALVYSLHPSDILSHSVSPVRIRVLTSCTKTKIVDCPDEVQLTKSDFEAGGDHLEKREQELSSCCRPAGEMYAGRQHEELMRGVRALRQTRPNANVDVHVLSAGYGVIPENQSIAPYNVSFSDMPSGEVRDWADDLDVPGQVREFLAARSDLTLLLLGQKYATAASVDEEVTLGGPVLYFCNQETARGLPNVPKLKPVVVSQRESTRFSEGIIWLKGHLARRLLVRLANNPDFVDTVTSPDADVLDLLDDQMAIPLGG